MSEQDSLKKAQEKRDPGIDRRLARDQLKRNPLSIEEIVAFLPQEKVEGLADENRAELADVKVLKIERSEKKPIDPDDPEIFIQKCLEEVGKKFEELLRAYLERKEKRLRKEIRIALISEEAENIRKAAKQQGDVESGHFRAVRAELDRE